MRPEQIALVKSASNLARLLLSYDQRTIEAFAEVCIAVLDRMGSDPDLDDDDPLEDEEMRVLRLLCDGLRPGATQPSPTASSASYPAAACTDYASGEGESR